MEPPVSIYPPLTDIDVMTYEDDRNNQHDSIFAVPSHVTSKNSLRRNNSSMLFNLMVVEEAHRAVSCEQIEANLIHEARDRAAKEEDSSNQEYYVNQNKHQEEESYWDMPSDNCDQQEENEESKVLSTAQVERTLVEDALRRVYEDTRQNKDELEVVNNHSNNAYWDWPSEPILESEKKAALIASVLLEESIRETLSIETITKNEVSNKKRAAATTTCSKEAQAVDDVALKHGHVSTDYWYWSSEESKDDSDIIVAPHVHDPTHPNNAYWDYPSVPEDLKKNLIDKILNEERIRELLSTEKMEEREINFHRSKKEAQENEDNYDYNPDRNLNSQPDNYWDFNASSENDLLSLLSREKQALINQILREEQLRYIVSSENIESNLVSSSEKMKAEGVVNGNSASSSSSSSYWDW